MNTFPTLGEIASMASSLAKQVEFHAQKAKELSQESDYLRQIEKRIRGLIESRRAAIQRRWDCRRELRLAREAVENLVKTGSVKKADQKSLPWESPDDIERVIYSKSAKIDRSAIGPGIYFLFSSNKLVYVGQSISVLSRVGSHQDKIFDRFSFIPVPKSRLNETERSFINLLLPELNIDQKTVNMRNQRSA